VTQTTNYDVTLPTPNASEDTWGVENNEAHEVWDGLIKTARDEAAAAASAASTADAKAVTADGKAVTAQNTANAALPKAGGTMTGPIAMGNKKVTGLGAPTADADATTRKWVQDAINAAIDTTTTAVKNELYPIGAIASFFDENRNPAELLGFGTWVAFGEGRVLVGAGTGYPRGAEGGSKTQTLADKHMPAHTHTIAADENVEGTLTGNKQVAARRTFGGSNEEYALEGTNSEATLGLTGPAGREEPDAFSVEQPYVVVNMWRRTA